MPSAAALVHEVFARFCAERRVPGLAYGVVRDGALEMTGGLGLCDTRSGAVPDERTSFRIASMTKSFTAAAVLLLRDEGSLRLDDPVVGYVPELSPLAYPSTDSPPLTVRSLLTMSSGLVEDDPWADRLLDLDHGAFGALLAEGVGFDHCPGTAYEYSNLGYALLGRVVAEVAGRPLRDVVSARLLLPLGMTSTTFDAATTVDVATTVDAARTVDAAGRGPGGGVAVGYRLEAGAFVEEPPLGDGAFGAMGGLSSTVADLARWVAFHLDAWPPRDDPDTGVLRRSSVREMAQGHRSKGADAYGYGLVAALHPQWGRIVSHSGGLPGFGSHMAWLADCGVGIIALANRTYAPVRAGVQEAIEVLGRTGALQVRHPPAAPSLVAAYRTVVDAYRAGDPAAVEAVALATYRLDRDDDRRPPDLAALRRRHGDCREVGPLRPTGALRGTWTMGCERGALEVGVLLGPTEPHRLQWLTVTASGGDPPDSPRQEGPR